MSTMLPIGLARDAVAAQFDYLDDPAPILAEAQAPRAPRTRSALSVLLHRLADVVAPAEYHPAH